VDFAKLPGGMSSSPHFPSKLAPPDDDDVPAGDDWFPWNPTIGPADGGGGPSAPNPMSPSQPDPMPSLLASTLNWRVPRVRR